jgi:uncharacterized membrane protein HdeD (DUF308 family)
MNTILKNWWILTIKGVITLVFGLLALVTQVTTMIVFTRIFAIFLLLSGILMIIITVKEKNNFHDRSWRLTEGFIDLIIGLIIVSFIDISTTIFLSLIAIWISCMGILQLSSGYRMRGLFNHYWILIFNGILAIAFAVLVFSQPIRGIVTLMVLIGLYATVFGGFLIISSVYIRKIFKDIDIEIPNKIGEDANQELSYY